MQELGISIVVPVYAGERYLSGLASAVSDLREAMEKESAPIKIMELILVDDEATDNSPAIIDQLAKKYSWVIAVHLSRNFGQHAATVAGVLHSSGEWVVTLDEDLQHPPGKIPDLLSHAVAHHLDCVYASPARGSVHGKLWRDGSSRLFKKCMEWLTGNPTIRLVNSFRLIRGPLARAVASVCGHNTYFDVVVYWFTQRIDTVKMDLHDRRFKENRQSGYNVRGLLAHAQRMIFSSQLRFLSLGVWFGVTLFFTSFLAGVTVLVLKLVSAEIILAQGWASIMVAVLWSCGLLSIMIGLCLQYLSTLVLKAHGRPVFFTVDRSSDSIVGAWLLKRKPHA